MPRKVKRVDVPRTKTTVFLRTDLIDRIPRSFSLTDAIEPLLEKWLSGEGGVKLYTTEMKRVYSEGVLSAIESLASQIIDTVAFEREPTIKQHEDESLGRVSQGPEAGGASTGGRGAGAPIQPPGNAKPRKKVG